MAAVGGSFLGSTVGIITVAAVGAGVAGVTVDKQRRHRASESR